MLRGIPAGAIVEMLQIRHSAFDKPREVLICIADHFEPKRGRPARSVERDRVARWINEYPALAQKHSDSVGRPPQHTFFYPADEDDAEHVEQLATLRRRGLGDVEVHLHHEGESSQQLAEILSHFITRLNAHHGLLRKDEHGRLSYGFIHGNWALANSHPHGRYCGVNDELEVLRNTGCYADFTMPSAPAHCQTRTINGIYYAINRPGRPKSHDRGISARVGGTSPKASLLMIQGPLLLDWRRRKYGCLPRIENGDLHAGHPPTLARLQLWLNAGVHVQDNADFVFVKLHTHGALEINAEMLLGEPMHAFHRALADLSRQIPNFRYRYVTAWEMACAVHQIEAGVPPLMLG